MFVEGLYRHPQCVDSFTKMQTSVLDLPESEMLAYMKSNNMRCFRSSSSAAGALTRRPIVVVVQAAMPVVKDEDSGEQHSFFEELDAMSGKHIGGAGKTSTPTGKYVATVMLPTLLNHPDIDVVVFRNFSPAECSLIKDCNMSAGPAFMRAVGGKLILPALQRATMQVMDEIVKDEANDHGPAKVFVVHGYSSLWWMPKGPRTSSAADADVKVVTLPSQRSIQTVKLPHFSGGVSETAMEKVVEQAVASFASGVGTLFGPSGGGGSSDDSDSDSSDDGSDDDSDGSDSE